MFSLIIAQVDKTLFQGEVVSLNCPGEMGELTVLAHHSALVSPLKRGVLRVVVGEGDVREFPIAGGVLEVGGNQATVIL